MNALRKRKEEHQRLDVFDVDYFQECSNALAKYIFLNISFIINLDLS